MHRLTSQWALAIALAAIYAAFWLWQTPGALRGPMGSAEIDQYLERIDALSMPAGERAAVRESIRAWAQADDGQPVLMLNLMRYREQMLRFEGAPLFEGSPQQANAYYEAQVARLLLGVGGYPLAGGAVEGRNIVTSDPLLDNWDRVLLVRYPSRRAFLDLLTDPAYAPLEPYKMMSMMLVLTPVQADLVIPELRWFLATLLLAIFLTTGWWRAHTRSRSRKARHHHSATPDRH